MGSDTMGHAVSLDCTGMRLRFALVLQVFLLYWEKESLQ